MFRRRFPFRKDSRLPKQLQRAMAAEAEATREAKAKIIRSDAELKATKYLTRAAEVINESSGGMQLRYLQVRMNDVQCAGASKDPFETYDYEGYTRYWRRAAHIPLILAHHMP